VNTREKLQLAISELRSHPVIGIDVEAHAFRYLSAQGFRFGLDPDPGRQKLPAKVEKIDKIHVLKCWMFSFET
jgi:hypothetical protein